MLSAIVTCPLDLDALLDDVLQDLIAELLQDQRSAFAEVSLQTKLRGISDDAVLSNISTYYEPSSRRSLPAGDTAADRRIACGADKEDNNTDLEATDNYDYDSFEEHDEGHDWPVDADHTSVGTSSLCWKRDRGALGDLGGDNKPEDEGAVSVLPLLGPAALLQFATYDNAVYDQQDDITWDRMFGECASAGFIVYLNETFEDADEDSSGFCAVVSRFSDDEG